MEKEVVVVCSHPSLAEGLNATRSSEQDASKGSIIVSQWLMKKKAL